MNHTKLSKGLKLLIVCAALCGIAAYVRICLEVTPDALNRWVPWLVILGCVYIPCYVALGICWKVAVSVGADRSFTRENGRRFHWIAALALWDSLAFFLANVIYWLVGLGHPGVALMSLLLALAGAAIALVCEGLSYLVNKAAALQDQSDLTI